MTALLLPACVSGGPSAEDLEAAFQTAHGLYLRGHFSEADDGFSRIILDEGEDALLLAEAYRYRGECRKALGSYALARFDFSMAAKRAETLDSKDHAPLLLECRTGEGDTYLYEAAYRQADRIFRELIEERPPASVRDPLLYRRYICASKLGSSDAERFLREIESTRNFDERKLKQEFLEKTPKTASIRKFRPMEPPAPAGAEALTILNRGQWHAQPTRSNTSPMTAITRITLHHTGGQPFESSTMQESAAIILTYQKNHQEHNGWADIGYHFLVDRAGRVWEGRPLRYQGAHAGDNTLNQGNIGIAVMGNYDTQRLTEPQQKAIVSLMTGLCSRYGISPVSQVFTHRELKATACPGKYLQAFVEDFRRSYRAGAIALP